MTMKHRAASSRCRVLLLPGLALAQKRGADHRRHLQPQGRPRSAAVARRQVGGLRRGARDQGHRQERLRHLDGELGRHAGNPADLVARQRVAAALEPGQQIPLVRVVAPGGEGRPAVADAPRRRRSDQGQRREGGRVRCTPGRPTASASCSSSASPIRAIRKTTRRRRGQEEDRAADRHRPLPVQAGRRRLPAQRADAPLPLRRRDEEGRSADDRHAVRRVVARRGRPTARGSRSSASAAPATSTATTTPTSG